MSLDVETANKKELHARIDDWNLFLCNAKEEFEQQFNKPVYYEQSITDFEYIQTIAYGAFNKVVLTRLKRKNEYFVLKIYTKEDLVKGNAVECVRMQRNVLCALRNVSFPFITRLVSSFQDPSYVYIVEHFSNCGGLGSHLRFLKKFDESVSLFFSAQAVLALEFIHNLGLVFRDLKPDCFILKPNYYLKLVNFGLCKRLKGRTYTICGTPEYMGPEMIFSRGYGTSIDWWALGVFIYDLNSGSTPFFSNSRLEMIQKIDEGDFEVPHTFSKPLKSLVKSLLQCDLSRRLGNLKDKAEGVKSHPWFKNINWIELLNENIRPPFRPKVSGPYDVMHYRKYQERPLEISKDDKYREYFEDF